jgi:hypothetical protein
MSKKVDSMFHMFMLHMLVVHVFPVKIEFSLAVAFVYFLTIFISLPTFSHESFGSMKPYAGFFYFSQESNGTEGTSALWSPTQKDSHSYISFTLFENLSLLSSFLWVIFSLSKPDKSLCQSDHLGSNIKQFCVLPKPENTLDGPKIGF